MADQETSTGGGPAIQGSIETGGGDAVLRDRITFNNNGEPALNYTLADLRIDIHFQKQEIDRLRDDLNRDRQTDANTTARLTNRLDTMQRNLDFLDEQVRGMLLLKPVPDRTQMIPIRLFNYLMITVWVIAFVAAGGLIFLAWSH